MLPVFGVRGDHPVLHGGWRLDAVSQHGSARVVRVAHLLRLLLFLLLIHGEIPESLVDFLNVLGQGLFDVFVFPLGEPGGGPELVDDVVLGGPLPVFVELLRPLQAEVVGPVVDALLGGGLAAAGVQRGEDGALLGGEHVQRVRPLVQAQAPALHAADGGRALQLVVDLHAEPPPRLPELGRHVGLPLGRVGLDLTHLAGTQESNQTLRRATLPGPPSIPSSGLSQWEVSSRAEPRGGGARTRGVGVGGAMPPLPSSLLLPKYPSQTGSD